MLDGLGYRYQERVSVSEFFPFAFLAACIFLGAALLALLNDIPTVRDFLGLDGEDRP
ncbi:hypothetical protein SPF06_00860 [Sinomonas sp. JGH33]|uniref:ABC transporter permease n=1 Tax=Sinomonas terricola TaxID=3110330 RepID=A0ABU5T104_9MICC|nr:hypothetical protein [Sinomonas sp. JGH33]